jgi:hypothetical protein
LAERHPDLFEKAVKYEQEHEDGRKFTWCDEESLLEIVARKDEIIENHNKILKLKKGNSQNKPLSEVFASALDEENDDFCFVCSL